jgi:Pyrimidine dimer DNA glycosylase
MQIFLPYPNFRQSLKALDNKRLGKQRVETYQIISAITRRPKLDGTPYKGWLNHPCTVMWRNNVPALKMYLNCAIEEWVERGFKNTMDFEDIDGEIEMPEWFGNEKFHSSHRANLLKKEPEFYSQYRWSEDPSNPYVWLDKDGKWYEQHTGEKGRVYFK